MLDYVIVQSDISPNKLESSVIVKIRISVMNDTFTSILMCLGSVVLVLSAYAFVWLSKRGNHDELMRRGGRYARLFELQASAYR